MNSISRIRYTWSERVALGKRSRLHSPWRPFAFFGFALASWQLKSSLHNKKATVEVDPRRLFVDAMVKKKDAKEGR